MPRSRPQDTTSPRSARIRGATARATARDVAEAVGVAPSTVSRALTQPHLVSPARRAQILQVAREMGYSPHAAGRGLTTGRTDTVAVIVPDLQNPLYATVLQDIQRRARAQGMSTVVADAEEDVRLESELLTTLATKADGAIVFSPRVPAELLRDISARVPLVLVNRRVDGVPGVVVDHLGGMARAAVHLRALGHRAIAYVAGPMDSFTAREGAETVRRATEGIELIEIGHVAPPTVVGGIGVTDQILASGATAVICYNDLIALGVLQRAAGRGVRVPEELSIIGFDDVPAAALVSPPLTTLAPPLAHVAQEAFEILRSTLAGEEDGGTEDDGGEENDGAAPPRVELLPSLIVRASTGVPEHPSGGAAD